MEQVNIQDGLLWLTKQQHPDVLTEHFIRQVHQQLLGEVWTWAGTFRNTEKNIGVAPEQIAIALRNLLDDVRYWIEHDVYPPREIALRFHHSLVRIHLFPNGNGRHARILTDVLLEKIMSEQPIGWGDANLLNASDQRRQYIDALRQADAGNYEPLFAMFI